MLLLLLVVLLGLGAVVALHPPLAAKLEDLVKGLFHKTPPTDPTPPSVPPAA